MRTSQIILVCLMPLQIVRAQSPHLLNSFETSTEGWFQQFGTIETIGVGNGKLTWTSPGPGGVLTDSFTNTTATFQPGAGGVDLTGLSAIEFVNVVYTGTDPTIRVEFLLQTDVQGIYKGSLELLGSDVTFTNGIPMTVQVPLGSLKPTDIAWVRTWGMNLRPHQHSARWSLDEVRSVGIPFRERKIAKFTPDSPDHGFQSIYVAFHGNAIKGNPNNQSQAGLSVNPSAGVDGSVEFVSLGGIRDYQNTPIGGTLAIGNGSGNFSTSQDDFYSRPTDLSNYHQVEWSVRALGPQGESIPVSLFINTLGWLFQTMGGPPQSLPVDGHWHSLTGSLTGLKDPDHVNRIGISFGGHPSNVTIQIDHVRAYDDQPNAILDWELY
jgi:hypothetical protein